ncbi:MAG: hypothetical protein IPJ46_17800 [Anaerolineales bacterium]|nr:hypothetical protein [Anaerolineales bacterium]
MHTMNKLALITVATLLFLMTFANVQPVSSKSDQSRSVAASPQTQTYKTKLKPGDDVNTLVAELSANPDVIFAKPDYITYPVASPQYASGDLVWAKGLGGVSSELGKSIAIESNGNIYIFGTFVGSVDFDPGPGEANLTSNGGTDIFIIKLDNAGSVVWARNIGGTLDDNGAMSIAVDSSGSVYMTGYFTGTIDFDPGVDAFNITSFNSSSCVVCFDMFFSKLDSGGNFVWAKSLGGPSGGGQSWKIVTDSNNNIYMTGFYYGILDFNPGLGTTTLSSVGGSTDIFIDKFDMNGNLIWARGIGDTGLDDAQQCYDIVVDSNSNVYTTGYFIGTVDFDPGVGVSDLTFSGGFGDIFVSKLDGNGNFVWAKGMGGVGNEFGTAIATDPGGNVYTTGYFEDVADFDPGAGELNLTSAGLNDIFISKLDSNGDFVWAKSIGGTGNENGTYRIIADSNSNLILTGSYRDTIDFDPGTDVFDLTSAGSTDIFVSRLDGNGNFVWVKGLGSVEADLSRGIVLDANDNLYVTGGFRLTVDFDPGLGVSELTSVGLTDIFIAKFQNSEIIPPTILSITRASISPTSASSVDFTVTFSEPVTGVDTALPFNDFTLTTSGITGASITSVTPVSGTSYTVSVNTGSGNGTIRLDVVDDNSIMDAASNPLGGAAVGDGNFATGEVYTITKPAGGDTTGVFRPSNGLLYLKNANTTGFADVAINYGTGGDYPIAGDWNGDGTATIGIYRNGSFYLRNSNTLGFADIVFAFGTPGDQPVAGDWDGDGVDTIGVYSNGQFLLRNNNSAGVADMSFFLGNPGDVGIAGDWNGDGMDTTGVFRPSNGIIFLKNANTTGFADIALNYGLAGDMPVTGDWNNDGIDTIGVYRNAQFLLRNSNTIGFAEIVFGLGNPGDMPISGNWDGVP